MVAEHATSIFFPKIFRGLERAFTLKLVSKINHLHTVKTSHSFLRPYLSTKDERYLSATRLILFCRWLNLTSKNCACVSNSSSLLVVLGLFDMTSRNTEKTLSPTAEIHCHIPWKSIKGQLIKVWTITFKISNGNRTEWSPKTKSDNRVARVRFV